MRFPRREEATQQDDHVPTGEAGGLLGGGVPGAEPGQQAEMQGDGGQAGEIDEAEPDRMVDGREPLPRTRRYGFRVQILLLFSYPPDDLAKRIVVVGVARRAAAQP
jgi:hypothetical protein